MTKGFANNFWKKLCGQTLAGAGSGALFACQQHRSVITVGGHDLSLKTSSQGLRRRERLLALCALDEYSGLLANKRLQHIVQTSIEQLLLQHSQ